MLRGFPPASLYVVSLLLSQVILSSASAQVAVAPPRFKTIVLTEEFHSEGADVADINGDGLMDVVSGPFWYEGPEFKIRHRYMPGDPHAIVGYSDHFFTWCEDLNNDGRADIVTMGMPGQTCWWFANPGAASKEMWGRHPLLTDVAGESPAFTDFDGDGQRDLIGIHGGRFGYATRNDVPTDAWTFHPISTNDGLGVFTHGMGVGDVDGDGKHDLLETRGWWRQLDAKTFKLQPFRFAQSGGAQMFAEDLDLDGDADVVSVSNAHSWGLNWFERRGQKDDFLFVPHAILVDPAGSIEKAALPHVALSQMHAMAIVDVDGDGYQDIVTGKRFWAHGGKDPGSQQLPLLSYLRTHVEKGQVKFEARLIHTRVGVGTQLTARDINSDGRVDFVIGNKLGTFVLLNDEKAAAAPVLTEELALIGTDAFRNHVRETEPLEASQQQQSFVAPPGFAVELVASEPQINKPLNMAFDPRGRLWVTSTVEYPLPAQGRKGRDSIKVLEDTTGDGNFDNVTTFADELNIPMGIYPYRDGAICFDIPNIVFLRDTDGDGKADRREQLYGPFDTTRDTHGMCNAFTRGDDGWLYACHGFNNQSKVAGSDGHEVEMNSGNVFRIKLDGSRIEHFGWGQVNPFGLTIDRWGDVYTADCHTKPINLVLRGGFHDSFGKPHDGLGYVPNVLEHLHGSTGVGGIALGESLRFPEHYRNSTFGGNVVTGRVNRNTLHRAGSVRAVEEPDFVVSGDPWFRPVDLQVGPDGALYIADFYNRIIGHYEVGLDHPGRDRQRGRIWRVAYRGDADKPMESNLTKYSITELFDRLKDASPAERRRIVNWLDDSQPQQAADEATRRLATALDESTVIACLWILARNDALTNDPIRAASQSESAAVRTHLLRVVSFARHVDVAPLTTGLNDEHPAVQRAAAMAAANQPNSALIQPLLQSLSATPPTAKHLRHALKMALKAHLTDPNMFDRTVAALENAYAEEIESICLALQGPGPGNFVAQRLKQSPPDAIDRLKELTTFAARHATPKASAELAKLIQSRLANDVTAQLTLLDSLHQPGTKSAEIRRWALALASRLAQEGASRPERLRWRFLPVSPITDSGDKANCWAVSTRRRCADGVESAPLYSSFPHGEQRVGIYQSAPFVLKDSFSFFLAGHDGVPDKPLQEKNLVRLRLEHSHEVIHQTPPPRNDVAQKIQWDTEQWRGQRAYLELVDQDRSGAFAWLAAGRFSDARLDPGDGDVQRTQAAQLVQRFRLDELRGQMAEFLTQDPYDQFAAAALAELEGGSQWHAVQQALSIDTLDAPLRRSLVKSLIESTEKELADLLPKAMKAATSEEQRLIAASLARDQQGLKELLSLVEQGVAGTHVLGDKSVRASVDAIGDRDQRSQVERWMASASAEAPELVKKIEVVRAQYLRQGGKIAAGRSLFQKNCGVCHQVAGQGKKVGPNLDGIGNRGLARLTEDVLAPNRNVDVAFRSTTLVTHDGEVLTGALLPDDGSGTLTLINAKGEPTRLAKTDVARQKKSPTSPMPENFTASVTDADLRNLLAYLLSLR